MFHIPPFSRATGLKRVRAQETLSEQENSKKQKLDCGFSEEEKKCQELANNQLKEAYESKSFPKVCRAIFCGADVNFRFQEGRTILHVIALLPEKYFTINSKHLLMFTESLLNRNVEVNVTDSYGNTPLHLMANHPELNSYRNKHYFDNLLGLMLSQNVDLSIQNKNGDTPIHLAIRRRSSVLKSFMVRETKMMRIKNYLGQTPLHLAIQYYPERSTGILLCGGYHDVNEEDDAGNTPLHIAVEHGEIITIRKLLDFHANVNVVNNELETPLFIALKIASHFRERVEVVDEPGDEGPESRQVLKAAMDIYLKKALFLLEQGASVNVDYACDIEESGYQGEDEEINKHIFKQLGQTPYSHLTDSENHLSMVSSPSSSQL